MLPRPSYDHPTPEERTPLVPVEPLFAQGDDVSDDDDRRRLQACLGYPTRDIFEGSRDGPLFRHGAPPDAGDRRIRVSARRDEPGRDLLQPAHAHVQNECIGAVGQLSPVHIRASLPRVLVPRDERDAGRDVPVRDGYAGVCRGSDATRHAWDDLEGKSGPFQRERLLTAAAEDVRVAALQAHDAHPGAALLDKKFVYLLLGHRGITRLLADVDLLGFRPRVAEQRFWREPVVDDGVGLLHAAHALQGEESWIPWPAADQVDHGPPSADVRRMSPSCPGKRSERQLNPPSTFLNSDISSSKSS